MSILKIARMGHPVLARRAEPVPDPRAPQIRRLVGDMIQTMMDANGAGLAAPQVHVPLRVLVFQAPQERSDPALAEADLFDHSAPLTVLINPEIEVLDGETEGGWEGCLSVPGLRGFVERPAHIRYRGADQEGAEVTRIARGFHARVVQHEVDHLDGILYPQRMKDLRSFIFEIGIALLGAQGRVVTNSAKPRKRPAKPARETGSGARDAVLLAALKHVPFEGFTDKVLKRAAANSGVPDGTLQRFFPDGPLSLVEGFSEWADAEMKRELAQTKLSQLKIRERIALAVKLRLAVLRPHKEAARRAAAFLTLPPHASLGVKLLYRTVDAVWRGIGDTSTDFSFYTKRAILAGVYSSTLLRWFSDTGADEQITDAFLQRRIDDVMRFEKFKARLRGRASELPTLSEILNPASRKPARPRSRAKGG